MPLLVLVASVSAEIDSVSRFYSFSRASRTLGMQVAEVVKCVAETRSRILVVERCSELRSPLKSQQSLPATIFASAHYISFYVLSPHHPHHLALLTLSLLHQTCQDNSMKSQSCHTSHTSPSPLCISGMSSADTSDSTRSSWY